MASPALAMLTLTLLAAQGCLGAFLGPVKKAHHKLQKSLLEGALLAELSAAGGAGVHGLMDELQPMFAAMPKNEHDKLEPAVVRYALHRFFAQKHGWHVTGLERAGGAWNASLSADVVEEQALSYILELFEERLHGEGLGLQELAVFAATVLDLARKEAVGDFEYVYEVFGWSTTTPLEKHFFDKALRVYMVVLLHGLHEDGTTRADFRKMEKSLEDTYMAWADTKTWVQDLRQGWSMDARRNPFAREIVSFKEATAFVEELQRRFFSFQNLECHAQKDKLVELEHRGTGRVRLSRFYGGSHAYDWAFTESVEYLRALGALDESDPKAPSVIIPNYVASKSNCVTPSSFYALCCPDECESLLAEVERAVAGPTAEPARLAVVIANLGSETVDAPRNLSTAQLERLEAIAQHHGGRQVPLHGRLFAQWMHHAYPRECPFPHTAHTTAPATPLEWTETTGQESTMATEEEMQEYKLQLWEDSAAAGAAAAEMEEALPWIHAEELVGTHKQSAVPWRRWSSAASLAAGLAVVASSLPPMLRAFRTLRSRSSSPGQGKAEKYLV